MKDSKIRVLVEAPLAEGDEFSRIALDEVVRRVAAKQVQIPTEVLAKELSEVFARLNEALTPLLESTTPLCIDKVSFSLGIDAQGKLSLLSAVSSSLGTSVGLTFTLSIRNQKRGTS